jgi:excisionase family DNA binding protein
MTKAEPMRALDNRLSLSVNEVAAVTGLGRTLLVEAITRGELPSVRVRGRRLVLVDDLRQYLAQHRESRAS